MNASDFELHPQLNRDCLILGDLELCRLLLMNESRYPWFILVPRRADICEIYQLPTSDQIKLIEESSHLSQTLADIFQADKMNVAAIGNIIPQLHIHHVVRYRKDAAWPKPVWGQFDAMPYEAIEILNIKQKIQSSIPLMPCKA